MKFFKKFTETQHTIFSTIATLITGISTTILNACANGTAWFYFSLGFFLVSISTVLTQTLFLVYFANENLKNIVIKKSGILPPSLAMGAQKDLEDLINSHSGEIGKIKIICYGTSGYGDFIKNIKNKVYPGSGDINLEVMFCSLDAVYNGSKTDRDRIEALAKSLEGSSNITVCYAKFLPTIRGCVVYQKSGKAIWSCLQTYSYSDSSFSSADYGDFYALVGSEDNDLLESNEKIITKEFERLKV